MGYRNEIEALQQRLATVSAERDGLQTEVESLREARDNAEGKIRREAYLRKELNKLRAMPERLANSEIRARQLEARIRELLANSPRAHPTPLVTRRPRSREMALLVLLGLWVCFVLQLRYG
ncbi:MAG: hypothetical protein AB8I08_13130 [Sandaracinaceae bacterium]